MKWYTAIGCKMEDDEGRLLVKIDGQEKVLTGKNDKSFAGFLTEFLETAIHKLSKFSRIAASRNISKLTGRIISNSGFCCITCDKTEVRVICTCENCFKILIWIETTAYTGDNTLFIYFFAILESTEK